MCSCTGYKSRRERKFHNNSLSVLQGVLQKGWRRTLYWVDNDRIKGNHLKLIEDSFRLDIRKKFLTVRVVRHWNRLPRGAVDAPSTEVFKARLDGTLANLI